MAESARESESSDEDITSVMSTGFTLSPSTSESFAVIFNNIQECYPPDTDIECHYTIRSVIKPNSRDWIGLFKVGWQSSREHYTYQWSPMPSFQDGEHGRPITNRVVFSLRHLSQADDEFYQFCYVTFAGDVRGASVPFQMKTKPIEQEELKSYEIEDDELELGTSLIMVVKNRTESVARALEENACLKASNEMALADLANANDKVMESESRKADLMAALIESEKKASDLEQALAQKNLALEEEQSKRKDLESANSDLKTMQEIKSRRVDELMKALEQERAQTSQDEKAMEKLMTERKQHLKNKAADQQMIEKLQNDLKAKEDESNNLKARWVEFETKARLESTKCAEKIEKANSEIGRLQGQVVEITEENNILKRNLEEQSERHARKVQDLYIELKNKDQELDEVKEEIAGYRCRIEEVEVESSLNAELLGSRIEELQKDSIYKQEFIHKLEQELEDANTQLEQEKGKITVLKEDSESTIRTLHDQLEGERASKQALCSQADLSIASLENQVQKQEKAIMELSQQLERRNTELSDVCGELDNFKNKLQSAEENLQISVAQLTAVQAEVKSLEVEKEILQMTLTDTQGAIAQSAASRYALQTAYAHIEKKYLQVEKLLQALWKERSKLKRTIATFHGNVPYHDLCLQMEERRNAELSDLCDELDNFKNKLQSADENLQISVAQLTAVQTEVKSLEVEKEILQMTLTDTQGAIAQSAASRYALQTAYAHIEKKYLQVKKQMEELWRERSKLKRTIATFHGNVPYDDLHLQMEEMRASNEDLRVRLNMGAKAFKKKSIECRHLEEQLYKVTRTSSVPSEKPGSALEMENRVSKLWRALEEEKEAQNTEKSLVLQKSDETYQVIFHELLIMFSWKLNSHSVGCLINARLSFPVEKL